MKGSFKKRSYLDAKTGGKRRVTTWTVTYDEPTSSGEPRRQRRKAGFATRKDAETWFDRKREQLEHGLAGIDEKTTVTDYFAHWLQDGRGQRGHLSPIRGICSALYRASPRPYPAVRSETIASRGGEAHLGGYAEGPWNGYDCAAHCAPYLDDACRRTKSRQKAAHPTFQSLRSGRHAALYAARDALARRRHGGGVSALICQRPGDRRGRHCRDRDRATPRRASCAALVRRKPWTTPPSASPGRWRASSLATRKRSRRLWEIRFKDPETARSRRSILLPAFAIERLRRHRREQQDRFEALGIWRTNETLVFDREGAPWPPVAFSRQFIRLVKRYKLPRVRFHDLRHSYATLMRQAGVDLTTVSQALWALDNSGLPPMSTVTSRRLCSSQPPINLTASSAASRRRS